MQLKILAIKVFLYSTASFNMFSEIVISWHTPLLVLFADTDVWVEKLLSNLEDVFQSDLH